MKTAVILCLCSIFLVTLVALCEGKVKVLENVSENDTEESRRHLAAAGAPQKCVKWGNTFDVSLSSKNLLRPCKLPDGRPICCSAVDASETASPFAKGVGSNFIPNANITKLSGQARRQELNQICSLTKVYVSSPQELRDLSKAKEISRQSTDHTDPTRLKTLVDYVYSEEVLRNSSYWLARVKHHMTNPASSENIHPHDSEFLSRFEFTRTCGQQTETWIEWIEPITITARHPYAFGTCRPVSPLISASHPRTGRSDVDYVLLQSGKDLHKQHYHESGRRALYNEGKRGRLSVPKHFMLDSGTSTFDSSLFWFTCGYAQVSQRHLSRFNATSTYRLISIL
ncbi:hypothetical protein EON65_02675 [archaeon]|nr:MAG: hypothetical protein EON65_02675 [archaeon]